ncbi:MAG TPA: hypothetical protein VIK29_07120 [Paludibacter sp.]
MPKIKDERVLKGKKNRDEEIRKYFESKWDKGLRYEVIELEIILKYGVSVSMINKIMKATEKQTN